MTMNSNNANWNNENENNPYGSDDNRQTACLAPPEPVPEKPVIESGMAGMGKQDESRTILDYFEETAIRNGRRIAVIDPEHQMTYGELFETSQRMAAEIAKHLHSCEPDSVPGAEISANNRILTDEITLDEESRDDIPAVAMTTETDGTPAPAGKSAKKSLLKSVGKPAVADGKPETAGKSAEIGRRIETGQPVAIFSDKNCSELTALLAVIYAGGFYVCINPEQTESRIASILAVLEPKLVIASDAYMERLKTTGYDGETLSLDGLMETLGSEPTAESDMAFLREVRQMIRSDNPLYGIFTSGSTGTPKCVLVEQQAVINFIGRFVTIFDFDAEDVIGNQAPFDFDVSVKDIYSALFTGASLVLIPREYFSTPPRLLDYICDNHVTSLTWAVSALCIVSGLKGFGYRVPTAVRRVLFSGEVMPIRQLCIWQENLPDAEFVNLYGPSEITCNCMYYRVQRRFNRDEKLPLGKVFPGRQVLLLDEENRPVTTPGEPGEICVLGESLARGYYHNPEQTAAHFVWYPGESTGITECAEKAGSSEDAAISENMAEHNGRKRMYRTGDLAVLDEQGQMFFAGRKDFQIKHMGHRIELEEIELQMNALDGVTRSCCAYDSKRSRLTAYYTGEAERESVHRRLKEKLPAYMIPWKFIHVREFRLNKNGKIDHRLLPELEVLE